MTRKTKVRKHKRRKPTGGYTKVKSHYREIEGKQKQMEQIEEEIDRELAEEVFEKRSEIAKRVDRDLQTRVMFATPNKLWFKHINRYDVWGIDGFEPPEVDSLPEDGRPYEVIKYDGTIYMADDKGNWTRQITTDDEIFFAKYDTKKLRERFEDLTDKNAIWQGKYTKNYKEWLKKEIEFHDLAPNLNYRNEGLQTLYDMKEKYNDLDLSQDDLKHLMWHVYREYYSPNKRKSKIKSYTKDFKDFYNRRYSTTLQDKIQAYENKIKERHKNPAQVKASKEAYPTNYPFRLYQITNTLTSPEYKYYEIGPFKILQFLKADPYRDNDAVIADILNSYEGKGDSDIDFADIDAIKEREIDQLRRDIAGRPDEYNANYYDWKQYQKEHGVTDEDKLDLESYEYFLADEVAGVLSEKAEKERKEDFDFFTGERWGEMVDVESLFT